MSKLKELLTYPPQILESRVETLSAELMRERESRPLNLLAWLSVILSLTVLGLNFGFSSQAFILPAALFGCFGAVKIFGSWCLRSNLRISRDALDQVTTKSKPTLT